MPVFFKLFWFPCNHYHVYRTQHDSYISLHAYNMHWSNQLLLTSGTYCRYYMFGKWSYWDPNLAPLQLEQQWSWLLSQPPATCLSDKEPVLVACHRSSKLPQTHWLKTAQICNLTMLDSRRTKSRSCQWSWGNSVQSACLANIKT